ncbi:MAG: hypothetical protein AUH30_06845 [Candidatus Rokubacteria bacterium 13_1_40CM_68_15]|nr:MAG: hypothetical protein AUH30_06845 [Candidatus Rokubacteria bacterium 13_1_40CM_68_15]
MPDALGWSILVAGALIGSVIGGVAGFGTGVILLPLIAWTLDIRATAPVLTVAMPLGNLARIWWNRTEIDRGVTLRFLAGAVPATAVGAMLYAGVTSEHLRLIVGGFLIAAVPLRRVLQSRYLCVRLVHFPVIGVVFGLLSAIVVSTGPVLAPFYLSYGLRRSAYIATEAMCALALHVTRGAVFTRYALLGPDTVTVGLVLGTVMFGGSWIGRRLLDRMSDRVFLAVIEALLLAMGLQLLLLPR